MRFKTFRALAIGGGLLGVFGAGTAGIWYVESHSTPAAHVSTNTSVPMNPPQQVTAAPISTVAPVLASSSSSGTALRPDDRAVVALLKQPIAGDKVKDALHGSGSTWKVNLYRDAGKTTPNRLKIDLNRNEKYDEKWSVDGATVKREVAPADDEKYTQEFLLSPDGTQWLASKGGAMIAAATPAPTLAASGTAVSAPAGSLALRPMDSMILERAKQSISGDKVKDAIPGQSWKVNLYEDAGSTKVNRLKIDLNRNDKWDEKWTFTTEGGRDEVKREVAPADDEKYTVEYRLRGGAWVRKTP